MASETDRGWEVIWSPREDGADAYEPTISDGHNDIATFWHRERSTVTTSVEQAVAYARRAAALPELIAALRDMRDAFRPFTSRPVGAPGSQVRAEQDAQIAAFKKAQEALAKASA